MSDCDPGVTDKSTKKALECQERERKADMRVIKTLLGVLGQKAPSVTPILTGLLQKYLDL